MKELLHKLGYRQWDGGSPNCLGYTGKQEIHKAKIQLQTFHDVVWHVAVIARQIKTNQSINSICPLLQVGSDVERTWLDLHLPQSWFTSWNVPLTGRAVMSTKSSSRVARTSQVSHELGDFRQYVFLDQKRCLSFVLVLPIRFIFIFIQRLLKVQWLDQCEHQISPWYPIHSLQRCHFCHKKT